MGVQRIDRTRVIDAIAGAVPGDSQRWVGGKQPAHYLCVVVAAVAQDGQQTRQTLDHLTRVGEENLRHRHTSGATHRDQMTVSKTLMHLGYWHAEQCRDPGQLIGRLVGAQNVVADGNTDHRPSVEPRHGPACALRTVLAAGTAYH